MKKTMKINKTIIFVFIFLLINQSFAYLINPDNTKIFGIAANDVVLVFDIVFWMYLMVKNRRLNKPKYEYKYIIFWLILICFVGSLTALINFGQPFFIGFRAHRTIIVSMLLYFPIYKLMYNNVIKKEDVIKGVEAYVVFVVLLYFTQFFLSKFEVYFLKVHIGSRYGNDRFYFDPLLLDFMYIYELNRLLNKKTKSLLPVLICLGIILEILIVQNFRLTFLGLAFVTVLGILFSKVKKRDKVIFMTILIILGTLFLFATDTGKDLVKTFFENNSMNSTMSIRHSGRKFYMNSIEDKMFFGMGYPNNSAYDIAKIITGSEYNYYLADNGIFGFMFMYGLFGIMWFATLIFKLFIDGFRMFKFDRTMTYIFIPIFLITICVNEIHWYWYSGPFILSCMLVFSNYEKSLLTGDINEK